MLSQAKHLDLVSARIDPEMIRDSSLGSE